MVMSIQFKRFGYIKMRKFIFLLGTLLFAANVSFADASPPVVESLTGCVVYKMCNAQTATGDCSVLPASGDELVLKVASFSNLTFYSTQSTATTYSCDVVSNDVGHDALSGAGHQINTASITESAPILSFSGLFYYLWVNCSAIANNQVTITLQVCTANR